MRRLPSLHYGSLLWLGLLAFCIRASGQGFTKLRFEAGKETASAGLLLKLEGPDDPVKPGLWEGPLTVARLGGSSPACTVNASLIREVYASDSGKQLLVISVSGSNTFIDFIASQTCARAWPRLRVFTRDLRVQGSTLVLPPLCECAEQDRDCSCTAGSVYALQEGTPPHLLPAASRALTRQQLGAAFAGTRRFARLPRSYAP